MKLKRIDRPGGLTAKLKLGVASLMVRERAPDILRVLLYRPEYFGQPYCEWSQVLLRGNSEWTVGERELMAAIVSSTNACQFCMNAHSQMASRMLGAELVKATLDDWRTAPLEEPLRLTMGMLVKLTKDPATVGEEDFAQLRAAGLSEDAIGTAVHICAHFCVINRVADGMGFSVPSAAAFGRLGAALLKHGYRV